MIRTTSKKHTPEHEQHKPESPAKHHRTGHQQSPEISHDKTKRDHHVDQDAKRSVKNTMKTLTSLLIIAGLIIVAGSRPANAAQRQERPDPNPTVTVSEQNPDPTTLEDGRPSLRPEPQKQARAERPQRVRDARMAQVPAREIRPDRSEICDLSREPQRSARPDRPERPERPEPAGSAPASA